AVLMIGCNSAETKPAEAAAPTAPDMNKVKSDIQALETAWGAAENAGDSKALAAFYTEDAVSMQRDKPMIVGREAIQKDMEAGEATRDKSMTVAYNVLDVFGDENTVTEVGTAIRKDSTGKVAYSGKYMAIWVKRDGKYLCIRDMSNSDAKEK
ncbi:MAG TPA: DUF4440 domain-containing protein, partial [Lacibacter sp.]|nr:DUF4440 domain-containing protein [Lacibacter sp.]